MTNILNKTTNLFKRLPASLFLWIAVIIFGAANAITKRLTEIGAENLTLFYHSRQRKNGNPNNLAD
ncbi:MAG: hypothetical protein MJK14_07410 [Rivularia sp. ALOHA_DT_140]|nr:hypothetical protein [Rivularia sp. ALOHA_DT_140]